jgi:hypothetical protein
VAFYLIDDDAMLIERMDGADTEAFLWKKLGGGGERG